MPLVIRKEQFAALQLESDIRWYEKQLAELYPSFASASVVERRESLRASVRRATALGVNRPELLQFLCFEHTYIPGCLDDPEFAWAREILEEPGRPSAERVKRLRQETIRRLLEAEAREEAEKSEVLEDTIAQDAEPQEDEPQEDEEDAA